MPRDSIFDRALVDDDDRNFEQQMRDLDVEVVKPKETETNAHSKNGFWVTKTKSNSYRVGTKALVEWLKEEGIKKGVYKLKEVKGGFIGVPEGRQK